MDPDVADKIFFPPSKKGQPVDNRRAKAICSTCPVQRACFMFAIAYKIPYGVWGGVTADERKRISRPVKLEIRRAWKQGKPIKLEEVI